jgi:hypothetical protein
LSATHLRHLLLSATKLAASAPLLAWAALTPSGLLSLRRLLLLSSRGLLSLRRLLLLSSRGLLSLRRLLLLSSTKLTRSSS